MCVITYGAHVMHEPCMKMNISFFSSPPLLALAMAVWLSLWPLPWRVGLPASRPPVRTADGPCGVRALPWGLTAMDAPLAGRRRLTTTRPTARRCLILAMAAMTPQNCNACKHHYDVGTSAKEHTNCATICPRGSESRRL